jgi:tetratricopeptide (TPR) repeat protein
LAEVWPHAIWVASLLLATLVAYRRRPEAGFLGLWVFLTLAPASSVLPIATQGGAERRMYLPMMGLVALGVLGGYGLERVRVRTSRAGAIALLACVVMALGVLTIARNREYASPLVLAETVLARWPTDVARGMVGAELTRVGRDEEAIEHLHQAARGDPTARYNLGVALFNSRRFDEAIRELEILNAEHPRREEIPWSRRLVGQAHAAQGRRPEAIAAFRSVLEMTPHDDVAAALLIETLQAEGVELATAGDHRQAVEVFRQAVALEPGRARLRANLATALIDAGDLAAAASEAEQAIALDRADAVGYDLLGRALALQGRLDEAIGHFTEALRLNPADAMIRQDLQRVLAVRAVRSPAPPDEQR